MGQELPGVQRGPCKSFAQNGSSVVFKEGILGPLSADQQARLCTGVTVVDEVGQPGQPSQVFAETRAKMQQIGKIQKCCLPRSVAPAQYLRCVEVSAKRLQEGKLECPAPSQAFKSNPPAPRKGMRDTS